MGRTRFTGPVYGAKQTLFSIGASTLSSGAGSGVSTIAAGTIVPLGEDWYVTEFQAFRGSTGSSATGFWVTDDSTVMSSITITSTVANANSIAIITPDGGEKEGARIASGSTVHFWYSNSSAQGGLSNCSWALFGYRRFVNSSRAE
jgi:hypothetical protein